ncbi:hypothetical protein NEUTE1DRAFT_111124 [Neurospora tetrasperma FGSC 2508]|uniref:Uncharacterized protein n=1 Tax=Neurospora tetrasperma (strain FGSC 2508 / ATCC MYA-4615 / P0657) TaxID=510951 RepID=F8MQP0_NEUT8|nr:uncharacterized protein NEUTE1DRAFT_111124 [Neurospora tetrasperma FGSC 2508]EGO56670.1 hypothetical protein NEUTE1DRAFT_111124 [Neurospora tetrasperma FGSC 2508]
MRTFVAVGAWKKNGKCQNHDHNCASPPKQPSTAPESVTEATGPELQLPMRGNLWGYDGNGSDPDVVAQPEATGVQTADERSNFQLGTCWTEEPTLAGDQLIHKDPCLIFGALTCISSPKVPSHRQVAVKVHSQVTYMPLHSNPGLIVGVVLRFTLFLLKFGSVDFGDASPGKALEMFPF